VPLLRAFYGPLKELVDEKRSALKRRDFTTEPSDEVCSEGHPMVVRLGRNGKFLACSLFPEHKESRPLPGTEEAAVTLPGIGEVCPKCGATAGGSLVAKRGRFGPFVGCDRYPECDYIKKDGPPPPDPLPFEVPCPRCAQGRLTPRRARRTGSVFWGCSRYPKCDFTTSHEPLGAFHDADGGPVARKADDAAMCLACGSTMELPSGSIVPGAKIAGGPPNPAALARAGRGSRGRGTATRGTPKAAGAKTTSRKRATKTASGSATEPSTTATRRPRGGSRHVDPDLREPLAPE
jgi:ssDNA-binding Zn-finger/Zn-ribbon topoisomerase 1